MLAAGLTALGPWGGVYSRVKAAEQDEAGSRPGGVKTKIVLVGHKPDHPPGTHLYLEECALLARCLRQTPGVEAVVSDGWPKDPSLFNGLNALVFYSSPGAELLFHKDHAAQAEALLKLGVGFTALHWATGISKNDENTPMAEQYLRALGGMFGFGWSKLDISPSRVEPTAPEHPISRGWTAFDLKDEWYINLKFLSAVQPLAKVRVQNQDCIVAWAYQRADSAAGRSYGNTLGHFHANFGQESLRKMIVNGVLWTAHREIPASGAPCAVAAQAS
jgi:type 1 glutamine amidotransferase